MAEAFVNPYTARVLKEATALRELEDAPLAPMYSPEEVARRRAEQRYNAELAAAMKLSGDAPTTALGSTLLTQALEAGRRRMTAQGEVDPLSGELRMFPEVQRQRQVTQRQRELDRIEAAEARTQATYDEARRRAEERREVEERQQAYMKPFREAQAELARERANRLREEVARGKPLTGRAYADMVQAGKDLDSLDEVRTAFEKYDPVTNISALGSAADWAARQAPELMPRALVEQQQIWAKLQRLQEMKQRHALFGATLSGNEKGSWDSVTPPRGASKDDMDKWIQTQTDLLERAVKFQAEALHKGGYSGEQLELFSRGRFTPPKPAEVPRAAPAVPGRVPTYNPVTGAFE